MGHREYSPKDQIGQKNVSISLEQHTIFRENALSNSQMNLFIQNFYIKRVETNTSENDFKISHILSTILDFILKKILKMFSIIIAAQRKIQSSNSKFINHLVFLYLKKQNFLKAFCVLVCMFVCMGAHICVCVHVCACMCV